MPYTIFFSWQADTSNTEGRNLIERALQKAIKAIGDDASIEDAVREDLAVDWATKGTPGRQKIFDTVMKKIGKAAIFVADFTFVGTRADGKRKTPNPNVMVEYGYALATITDVRIITVMNAAHGAPLEDHLPFDLQGAMFPTIYNCPDGADEAVRKEQKDKLSRAFEKDIRLILDSAEFKKMMEPAKPDKPHPHDVALLGKLRSILSPELQTFLGNHNFRYPHHHDLLNPLGSMLLAWVGAAHKFHDARVQESFENLKGSAAKFMNQVTYNTFVDDRNPKVVTPLRDIDRVQGISEHTLEAIKKMNEAASALSQTIEDFECIARERIPV